ncbi:two-component system response regulator RssB [Providencia burhodogranariea]|uniref:Regulator of RpoS n=1 Tax=Providencia burhodogranariea DSM 19968 TaxID=1141662 RepID=K8X5E5_9GAMM|nr:two-component system response regulator RssB [Providencia burhodogranariea]EKT63690.1 response regulator of RpoS [Providencia burhodogranariea DSM 19968]
MKNKKILIVEDEKIFRSMLEGYLESQGMQVLVADNGQSALEQLTVEKLKPDVILCDLNMPIMSGEAFMEQLVAKNINIPVIVISATTDFTQFDRMFRLGAKDALLKPIKNLDELKVTIHANLYPEQYDVETLIHHEVEHVSPLLDYNNLDITSVLKQLQPPVNQSINGYRVNYRQLNEINKFGLVIDLAPISDSQIGFYCIDIERSPQEGVMAAFLIRVVFNNLLKNAVSFPDKKLPNIDKVINQINYLLEDSGFTGQYPILLGYFNTQNKAIILASAGLEAEVATENAQYSLSRSIPLGTLKHHPSNHLDIRGAFWQCRIWNNHQKIKLMFNPEV